MKNMKKCIFLLILIALIFLNFAKPVFCKPYKAKDYAVFFAVNDYEDKRLDKLKNPINDAENIANMLSDHYGFQTEVIKNPTLGVIQRKIEEYRQNFASGRWDTEGQLLIYFTGHGSKEDDIGYFLPSDVQTDQLATRGSAYAIWRRKIAKLKCKHILVTVDACYSGTFDPEYETKNGDPLFGSRGGELTEVEKLLVENEHYQSRFFFTSSSEDQTTPDQSNFAQKFLEGLNGKFREDGILSSDELWFNYLKQSQPKPRGGTFEGNQADANFLFSSTDKPNYERTIIPNNNNNSQIGYLPEMVLVRGRTYKGNKIENFYMGKFEINILQFSKFIENTGFKTDAEKNHGSRIIEGWGRSFSIVKNANWKCDESGQPRSRTERNYPVIHVSWNDAVAYCQWLNTQTGKLYRLPTDSEWEFAASNAKGDKYSWGNDTMPPLRSENLADETLREKFPNLNIVTGYNDGFITSAPVGFFKPNLLGFYDIGGNVSEWCLDSYNKANQINSKAEGDKHTIKGGNWKEGLDTYVKSRFGNSSNYTDCTIGFRIALDK